MYAEATQKQKFRCAAQPAEPESAPENVVALIERLARLRDQDPLTEEEFQAQKSKSLGRLSYFVNQRTPQITSKFHA